MLDLLWEYWHENALDDLFLFGNQAYVIIHDLSSLIQFQYNCINYTHKFSPTVVFSSPAIMLTRLC